MKKIILTLALIFPTITFAQMPDFPMAFYGSATINGSPAPLGTIIRAYYGDISTSNLAGETTAKENGVYGEILSTGQKLLVKEGSGRIVFTFQSPSILNNQETKGTNEVSYTNFESGIAKEFNMAFKYEVPIPPVPPPPPPSGGGGGGGGGSRGSTSRTIPTLPSQASAVAQTNVGRTGSVLDSSSFFFSKNLSVGSSGNDVTELQKRLIAEGVYEGPITGYFGSLTTAGVKAYQLKYEIEQVGTVGPKTRAQLNQNSGAVLGAQNSAMTTEQMKTLLAQLQTQVAALMAKLNSLSQ